MALELSPADTAELQATIARWAEDPVAFVLEAFGPGYEASTGKPLVIDRWQEKALRALVKHEPHGNCDGSKGHKRIAAKACKGPGKTAWESWVGWWRLLLSKNHRGAAVSITGGNLRSNLWPELALWQSYSPLLSALFEHKGEDIKAVDAPKTWWLQARAFADDAQKDKQADTLAGLHSEFVTVLLDEVGSFPHGVLDAANAIFNVKGQDCLLLAAGNCTDVDGALYRICTEDAADYYIVEITGDPDDPDRSPRIDIEVARREIAKHGRNDPVVMVNILGKFPPRGGNKLLGPEDVAAAVKRRPAPYDLADPWVWGLDVAGEGLDPDNSVLYRRKGALLMPPDRWRNIKTLQVADRVAYEYEQARKRREAPKRIFIDRGGIGRGCWERLHSLLGEPIVVGVDFGESALDEAAYTNRRTEMWCKGAAWVRELGCLPDEPELRRDLCAPSIGVESTTSKGTRRLLESKKQMKARGLPSPDDGDSFVLTFAAPVLDDEEDWSGSPMRHDDETYSPPWERSAA